MAKLSEYVELAVLSILFLAYDVASYITGSVLKVDGGLYIEGSPSLTAESQDR
ncbi:hypothetical protein [Microcoleus sp. herbarium2]|uniref:hypothetical protein n=1 Tax=Microcoleus sp. herbarium2 TaxID=3055433 RepID=UPI002FD5DE9C